MKPVLNALFACFLYHFRYFMFLTPPCNGRPMHFTDFLSYLIHRSKLETALVISNPTELISLLYPHKYVRFIVI